VLVQVIAQHLLLLQETLQGRDAGWLAISSRVKQLPRVVDRWQARCAERSPERSWLLLLLLLLLRQGTLLLLLQVGLLLLLLLLELLMPFLLGHTCDRCGKGRRRRDKVEEPVDPFGIVVLVQPQLERDGRQQI